MRWKRFMCTCSPRGPQPNPSIAYMVLDAISWKYLNSWPKTSIILIKSRPVAVHNQSISAHTGHCWNTVWPLVAAIIMISMPKPSMVLGSTKIHWRYIQPTSFHNDTSDGCGILEKNACQLGFITLGWQNDTRIQKKHQLKNNTHYIGVFCFPNVEPYQHFSPQATNKKVNVCLWATIGSQPMFNPSKCSFTKSQGRYPRHRLVRKCLLA